MRENSLWAKLVAATLAVAIQSLVLPLAAAPAAAGVSGAVFEATDQKPLSGAKVHLGNPKTGEIFSSQPTGDDGVFEVSSVPAATYEIAIEANGGLFLVGSPVKLGPGQNQALALNVNPTATADPGSDDLQQMRGTAGLWNNPLTATLLVVGSAIVAGVLIDQATNDSPASGTLP